MAFNPFHAFRKHQKVMFAVLTIVCMLTFVLVYGRGDIFDRLAHWAGTWRAKPNESITIGGQGVTSDDLIRLRQHRAAAWEITRGAAQESLTQSGAQQQLNFEKLGQAMSQFFVNPADQQGAFMIMFTPEPLLAFETLLDFVVLRQQADQMGIQLTRADIEAEFKRRTDNGTYLKKALDTLRNRPQPGLNEDGLIQALGDEMRVHQAAQSLLGQQQTQGASRGTLRIPPAAPFSVYDFQQYYQDQCAKLNVAMIPVSVKGDSFDPKAVDPATRDEQMRNLFEKYKNDVPKPNSPTPGFKQPQRMRVQWVGVRGDSPYFRYQANQLMPLYPLGSALQLAQVGPMDNAFSLGLRAAFAAGPRNKDNQPTILDPSFAAAYDQMVRDKQATAPAPETVVRQVGLLAGSLATNGIPLMTLRFFELPADVKRLASERDLASAVAGLSATDSFAAATFGAFAGTRTSTFPVSPILSPPAVLSPDALRTQVMDRAKLGLSRRIALQLMTVLQKELDKKSGKAPEFKAVLANAQVPLRPVGTALGNGNLGVFSVVAGVALGGSATLPIHFDQQGETAKLEDQFSIVNDPALQPFLDQFLLVEDRTSTTTDAFGQMVFTRLTADWKAAPWPASSQQGTSEWERQFPGNGFAESTRAQFFPDPSTAKLEPGQAPILRSDPLYLADMMVLFWRTENVDAKVPKFEDVVAKVEEAWKLVRARGLAYVKALELSKSPELQKALKDSPADLLSALKDLAAKAGTQIVELRDDPAALKDDAVCRQKVGPSAHASLTRSYTPYKFPASSVPDVGPAFLDKVMTLSPDNRVLVAADETGKTYWVAVLLDKVRVSDDQVLKAFSDGPSREPMGFGRGDQVFDAFINKRQTEYVEGVLKALRINAGAQPDGQFKIPEDFRKVVEGKQEATEDS